MIEFRVDTGSGVPPYRQLVHQVEHALRLGRLRVGDRLPTVKDVAKRLVINPNTVLKAYRELEHKGLVKGRPGQGTFVERGLTGLPADKQAELRAGLERWLAEAYRAGMDSDGIAALVATVLHDFKS
ncbi:GntR family transcriptional regulator [Saccharopolyspora erythraea NRRL 2338]|uniref:GntR family transcriptional regulator n=2 Tax=Saccharopolyspora erythraea TaxID=1836 RepID=A4FQM8_SACEN|nr:GntR family transcriptional regulator [Saccharopolyspora erythraea]EQD87688.1 GntR family transcriptional regulator [Saccharopolyspora erythraea D]PFG92956.1 GntR family transcriptional regulator [Saccharopolyspora erythraea NRRL 2338]QRK89850.1 GntR family transcriptional regulator [Saccharopolyspora erythraea]CAM06353.1 GntR family transcriptional regulator [Saccharopolyspora erythraea NRRL 2338]